MKHFFPGLTKPGLDWRNPTLGVFLLDEVSVEPVVSSGQWTFATLFQFGMRLGRLGAIAAQFADADEEVSQLMHAGVFWAEADVVAVLHEMVWRYQSAKEITEAPPTLPVGLYDSGDEILRRVTELANWVGTVFIGPGLDLMKTSFFTGLNSYGLFDPQFNVTGLDSNMAAVRNNAVEKARDWLKWTAVVATGGHVNASLIASEVEKEFGIAIPLNKGKAAALYAIDALDENLLIDKLFAAIPRLVDLWHPQLAHTLAPLSVIDRDWDWYEDQIRDARARGEQYPCVVLSAGGELGIGRLPPNVAAVPELSDPDKEVHFVDNETFVELILVVSWENLRAGSVPGLQRLRPR